MGWQTRIARNYGADLLGKAMLRLDSMLDENGADKRTQLNAIQTVLRMNHVEGKTVDNEQGIENINLLRNLTNITVTGLPGEKPKAVNPPDLKFMK